MHKRLALDLTSAEKGIDSRHCEGIHVYRNLRWLSAAYASGEGALKEPTQDDEDYIQVIIKR